MIAPAVVYGLPGKGRLGRLWPDPGAEHSQSMKARAR